MRKDAMRRAQQMQQRVPYKKSPDDGNAYLTQKEDSAQETPPEKATDSKTGGGFGLPAGIDRLLEQIDTDRMLILALLAMLYKDGGNKKLMMALAYLLT